MEYDAAAGNGFCVACGTVIEENTIVNELAFGESSSGAATVQGSYVALGASAYFCSAVFTMLIIYSARSHERAIRKPRRGGIREPRTNNSERHEEDPEYGQYTPSIRLDCPGGDSLIHARR